MIARIATFEGGNAKLVPRYDRRPDDPSTGPARDVYAGGLDRFREVKGSHAIYASQPAAVAEVVKKAASST